MDRVPMDDPTRHALIVLAQREAAASAEALALVERAVADGRLNIAKVLRARALACSKRAQLLARASLPDDVSWDEIVRDMHESVQRTVDALTSISGDERGLAVVLDGLAAEAAILERVSGALLSARDVAESAVAPILWGCETCGYIVEADRPELCPACEDIGGEFRMFAPFFAGTSERIGRRTPADALEQLAGDAARLREAMTGVPDYELRWKGAETEWCVKEIAGHMIDVCELATRAVRATLEPSAPRAQERTPLPWKLLDYEQYPEQSGEAILSRFAEATSTLEALLRPLSPEAWRTRVGLISGQTPMVDVASWVVNHNTAHLQQIIAIRERGRD